MSPSRASSPPGGEGGCHSFSARQVGVAAGNEASSSPGPSTAAGGQAGGRACGRALAPSPPPLARSTLTSACRCPARAFYNQSSSRCHHAFPGPDRPLPLLDQSDSQLARGLQRPVAGVERGEHGAASRSWVIILCQARCFLKWLPCGLKKDKHFCF